MVADPFSHVERAAAWAELSVSAGMRAKLEFYHDWLASEAIKAGGLGPNERNRIWSRHIADSMLFGVALGNARSCVDVGTGVGLPGLPLAIVRDDIRFDLVDRSGRRTGLLRRIVTVLELENCRIVHGDIKTVDNKYPAVISRASLSPPQLMIHVKHLLERKGIAVVGLSRRGRSPELPICPPGWAIEVLTVPDNILDTPVSLLRIVAA